MVTMPASHPITDPAAALDFALAGDARLTLVSTKTGVRYTYRITAADVAGGSKPSIYFVSVMYGPSNADDFVYMGVIRAANMAFGTTNKSKVGPDDVRYKAFAWAWANLAREHRIRPELEVWHEGRCGRCHRLLTVPESVASGMGPECSKRVTRFSAERVAA